MDSSDPYYNPDAESLRQGIIEKHQARMESELADALCPHGNIKWQCRKCHEQNEAKRDAEIEKMRADAVEEAEHLAENKNNIYEPRH